MGEYIAKLLSQLVLQLSYEHIMKEPTCDPECWTKWTFVGQSSRPLLMFNGHRMPSTFNVCVKLLALLFGVKQKLSIAFFEKRKGHFTT